MKRTTAVLATILIYCSRCRVPAAQQQSTEAPSVIESRWHAKIIKVSTPDAVKIYKPGTPVQKNERRECPPENERWLVVRLQLDAPRKAAIEMEEISVVNQKSTKYPAKGVAWQQGSFVLCADIVPGVAVSDGRAREVIYLSPDNRKIRLTRELEGPSDISFLFSIPLTTQSLYLQMGNIIQPLSPLE